MAVIRMVNGDEIEVTQEAVVVASLAGKKRFPLIKVEQINMGETEEIWINPDQIVSAK